MIQWPNLGLFGQFELCEEGIIAALNKNFLLLDALVQASVVDMVASLPLSPADGDLYILTTNDHLMLWDGLAWIDLTPQEGYMVWVEDENHYYFYDGTDWVISGDVTGPSFSTDNRIARWDGTSGRLLQNSLALLSDAGLLTTPSISTTLATISEAQLTLLDADFEAITVPTGAITLATPTKLVTKIQSAVTQINSITSPTITAYNRLHIIVNEKASGDIIISDSGNIRTGEAGPISIKKDASAFLMYDDTLDIWRVISFGSLIPLPGSSGNVLTSNGTNWVALPPSSASFISKTAAYTALTTDELINVDSTGGAFTITLPTAVGNAGKTFTFTKTNNNALGVTIDAAGTETINGALTKVLYLQYARLVIYSNGANWNIRIYDHPTVALRYNSNNATNITTSIADYAFTNIDYDTHSTYNTTTGEFTCPEDGIYKFDASLTLTAQGGAFDVVGYLYKNGSSMVRQVRNIAGSSSPGHTLSDALSLVKGDIVKTRYQVTVGSSVISSTTVNNVLVIEKIK